MVTLVLLTGTKKPILGVLAHGLTNMSDNSLDAFSRGFYLSGAISSFLFGAFWIVAKICDQDEQIEELFSRLEDCKKKNAENHELKKKKFQYIMSDNKLVKTILDAATLTGVAAGIGWIAKGRERKLYP